MKPTDKIDKIGVVGAGSWGTALAQLLAEQGYPVDLWVFETDLCRDINERRENTLFLPGTRLSRHIHATSDLSEAVGGKDLILVVVPSHVYRTVMENTAAYPLGNAIFVTASKGIENDTYRRMSEIIGETIPHITQDRICALSGPSFAKEVARHVPTVVTVASPERKTAEIVQRVFSTPAFRAYTSDDMIGVELGGAVKNVIAIASGMGDGLGLGYNSRAALITRGIAEIRRLGLALGANPRTFSGPAGIGDLILTCTAELSRNYTVGKKIGEGRRLKDILADMNMVAEGVKTARSVYHLSSEKQVEMPICHEVYRILHEDAGPKNALKRLMTRDLKHELDEQ